MANLHNRVDILLHFVWSTHKRMPLITNDIERSIYRYIVAVCKKEGCHILAIGGTENHIHLLISFPTDKKIWELVRNFKGGSSRLVTNILKPGEFFQWQGNYGVFSVSPSHKNRVINYIKNQKQHHANGTLWKNAEESSVICDEVPEYYTNEEKKFLKDYDLENLN